MLLHHLAQGLLPFVPGDRRPESTGAVSDPACFVTRCVEMLILWGLCMVVYGCVVFVVGVAWMA